MARSILAIIPPTVAYSLLAAHFWRSGHRGAAMIVLLVLSALLPIRRRWSVILLQAGLLAGTALWLSVLLGLVRERMARGLPWERLALILAVVAIGTALSGLLLRPAPPGPPPAAGPAPPPSAA